MQERLGRGHNHTEGRSPGVPVCSAQLGQPALLFTFTLLPRRRKKPCGAAHLGPLPGLTMWSRAGSLRLPRGCREDGRRGQQVFPSFGPGLICWLSGPVLEQECVVLWGDRGEQVGSEKVRTAPHDSWVSRAWGPAAGHLLCQPQASQHPVREAAVGRVVPGPAAPASPIAWELVRIGGARIPYQLPAQKVWGGGTVAGAFRGLLGGFCSLTFETR